jgi:hypothetical protein
MNHVTSPATGDSAIEQEIQAKGKTAPRVTPADIQANIASEWYINAGRAMQDDDFQPGVPSGHPLFLLTFCVLVLQNGFTVTGESACASPENFDEAIGRKVARENAVAKIWPLMGYTLKQRLHDSAASGPKSAAAAGQFRKKPVVIQAFQMTEARRVDNSDWPNWLNEAWQKERGLEGSVYPTKEGAGDGTLSCGTLEGQHLISWGDWIIQGVKGELYPCKPDIFAATYSKA